MKENSPAVDHEYFRRNYGNQRVDMRDIHRRTNKQAALTHDQKDRESAEKYAQEFGCIHLAHVDVQEAFLAGVLHERNECGVDRHKRSGICVSRYTGQMVLIQKDISVRLIGINGDRVKLYIEAPSDVRIERPSKDQDRQDRTRRLPVITGNV